MYDPSKFYMKAISPHFKPGDILFIKNNPPSDDSNWMVITSICDCEHRELIVLSKIMAMDSLSRNTNYKDSIRKYKVYYLFYLPQFEDKFPESFVHYGMLDSESRTRLEQASKANNDCELVISLQDERRRLLQYHLANHFSKGDGVELFAHEIYSLVKNLEKI